MKIGEVESRLTGEVYEVHKGHAPGKSVEIDLDGRLVPLSFHELHETFRVLEVCHD